LDILRLHCKSLGFGNLFVRVNLQQQQNTTKTHTKKQQENQTSSAVVACTNGKRKKEKNQKNGIIYVWYALRPGQSKLNW
jgi:hypothetical protein